MYGRSGRTDHIQISFTPHPFLRTKYPTPFPEAYKPIYSESLHPFSSIPIPTLPKHPPRLPFVSKLRIPRQTLKLITLDRDPQPANGPPLPPNAHLGRRRLDADAIPDSNILSMVVFALFIFGVPT